MQRVCARPLPRLVRWYSSKSPLTTAFQLDDDEEVRYRSEKNAPAPEVGNIEKRWLSMDAGRQDDVIAFLEDRMKGDWKELTVAEKQAIWYISYGKWGPRSGEKDLGELYNGFAKVTFAILVGVSSYKVWEQFGS